MRGEAEAFHLRRFNLRVLIAGVVLSCSGEPVRAQATPPPPAASPASGALPSPGSPRTSVVSFLELSRAGRWDEAARFLERPQVAGSPAALAERVKAVLDAYAWLDPSALSPLDEGKRDDGLPPDVEEIATFDVPGGRLPVRLVRTDGEGPSWIFDRATVTRLDELYGSLRNRWALEHLPAPLLRPGPRDLLYWQWLALPLILVGSWGVGLLLGRLTHAVLLRVAGRTSSTLDDELAERLERPIALLWALVVVAIPISALNLYEPADRLLAGLRRAGILIVLFWAALRALDLVRDAVASSGWARQRPSALALVPLSSRVGKVLLSALAAVSALAALGYPVTGLLAGLGIGGLALALAAQKTVENLFGSFSIGIDQPFREGDLVKIDDTFGNVERIGLRSSRIRTFDRTLVTIPNGRLAELRVETFAARDRLRLTTEIGLTYGTGSAQIRRIVTRLEAELRSHPKLWPDSVTVAFQSFGESSLNLLVMAWFETTDWAEFLAIRQEMYLRFMEIVEEEGSSFAFPTRTVHFAGRDAVPG